MSIACPIAAAEPPPISRSKRVTSTSILRLERDAVAADVSVGGPRRATRVGCPEAHGASYPSPVRRARRPTECGEFVSDVGFGLQRKIRNERLGLLGAETNIAPEHSRARNPPNRVSLSSRGDARPMPTGPPTSSAGSTRAPYTLHAVHDKFMVC